jgi:carotenoid cleavage dioxygenase
MPDPIFDSPYLQGASAPVSDELDLRNLEVIGEIPAGLRGCYLRNGPNPAFTPKGEYHIWDGDGMLHALTFDEAGVHYRNRWIATAALQAEERHGRALYCGMMDNDPPDPELVGGAGPRKNPANTNIVRHAGKLLALWEGGLPTALTEDLETIGVDDFAGALRGSMTAHPKIDPVTGEMFAFGSAPFPPFLNIHKFDASGKLAKSVEVDLPRAVMIHDFMVTEQHIVVFDSPLIFDIDGLARGGSIFRWAPEYGTRIGVMPRNGEGSDMRWFDVENCNVFHFMNGWNEGSRIELTAASMPWASIDFENEEPPEGMDVNAYLNAFSIDLGTGQVSKRQIGDITGDFCRVADSVAGRKHRYGYMSSFSSGKGGAADFDSITMYDLETGSEKSRGFGPGTLVGECSFAPNVLGDGAEDDGWIVNYVYAADGSESEFVVIDPRNFLGEPVARIRMPRRVPIGFHGNWLPAK